MVPIQNRLILWTGRRQSGKTTSAHNLVQVARNEGFNVAGLLALSKYSDGRLVGFDGLDLRDGTRIPLASLKPDGDETERFTFTVAGLRLGSIALSPSATKSAELIIVDEFGPLELHGKGWRRSVDSLLTSADALLLLVVRQELSNRIQNLYATVPSRQLAASEPESIGKVITMLKDRRNCSASAGTEQKGRKS